MVILTYKEDRILKAYLRGMETPEIGQLCGVGTSAVCSYLCSVVRKFGFKTREELHRDLVYEVKKYKRA
jgi:DNA-binding NarL/FixJ family response regulator